MAIMNNVIESTRAISRHPLEASHFDQYNQSKSGSSGKRIVRSIGLMFHLTLLLLSQANNGFAQNPLAPAGRFNVFLQGNATLITNESEGAVAIGGNLTVAGNYQVAVKGNSASFTMNNYPIGLVVGGGVKLQTGTLQVNSNTYAKIGNCGGNSETDPLRVWYKDNNGAYSTLRITKAGANYGDSPTILINRNATSSTETDSPICQSSGVNFSGAFAQMTSTSQGLSQCPQRVKLTNPNGQEINSTNLPSQVKIGLYAGVNVLNITGDDLNRVQNLTYTNAPSAGQVLLINVNAPGAFTWNTPSLGGVSGNNAPYILWNFYNATQLTIGGNSTIEGSVLAPLANVVKTTNSSNIEGQLVAQSFIHSGGEMHDYPFNADVPVCNNPLPVRLTSFSAAAVGSAVQLAWTTTWEQNSDYFVIERSKDAREFFALGRTSARGQSSDQQRYIFLDVQPLGQTAYYRLRMVDTDGSFDYSKIVAVAVDGAQPSLQLLANPVMEPAIRVQLRNWTAADLRLTNSFGQPVACTAAGGTQGTAVVRPLQTLKTGVYLLTAQRGGVRQSVRVVVP